MAKYKQVRSFYGTTGGPHDILDGLNHFLKLYSDSVKDIQFLRAKYIEKEEAYQCFVLYDEELVEVKETTDEGKTFGRESET